MQACLEETDFVCRSFDFISDTCWLSVETNKTVVLTVGDEKNIFFQWFCEGE